MLTKDKIKDWITKMQIKWETNDKFRLPDVVYETYQKAILDVKEEIEILRIKNNVNYFDKLSQEQVSWNNALDMVLKSINSQQPLKNSIEFKFL